MTTSHDVGFDPPALLASCVLPGGGHALRGDIRRALGIAAGVLGLFFGGILIGGVDVIDSKDDRPWFFGQALVGPLAFGADSLHQKHFKVTDPVTKRLRPAYPDELREVGTGLAVRVNDEQGHARTFTRPGTQQQVRPDQLGYFGKAETTLAGRKVVVQRPNTMSIGRVNELGMLSCALAGMLNLIAVIDAGFPTRRGRGKAVGV